MTHLKILSSLSIVNFKFVKCSKRTIVNVRRGGSNGKGKRKRMGMSTENTMNDNRKLSRNSSGRKREKSARTIQNPSMNEGGTTEKGTTSRSEDGKGVDSNVTVNVDVEDEPIHIADTEGNTGGQSIGKE
ncbi:hypothetical protein KY290_025046 [Solanum tuberosum]|uniref:Uncharacterized protein n=1 Tax=Solanum tuberosum TaxID=4113 RepID=A0ABQ7UUG0_SOLTU|nr:hypothetical protein KY284_023904 [Solanum tuberosum]KAH0754776.1 hypothetical protein KY290_025046 [Solanum tuberosum]